VKLLAVSGALAALAAAAHAQSAMPVDQKQPWFNACQEAVTAKVRAKQMHAEKLQWLLDTVMQRQKSNAETAVNGQG
jgi:hypothetical protein